MRLRLLPIVLFAGGLLLTVKVGNIWQELALGAGRDVMAETAPATEPGPGDPAAEAAADEPAGAGESHAALDGADAAGENLLAPGSVDDPLSYTDQELQLLQSLSKRRDELNDREQRLEEREALIAATERRIDDKLAELRQVQALIEALVKQHEDDQDAQMKSLVKIYENMKPKDAAQIFENLEMDVLLDVVEGMKERKVAPILALMDPAKAQEVTLELAQRRDLPLPK